ncbi:hypothetical protein [Leptospira ilyithenensis]|uniref:Uncharacterized protein n=1 Tax=Leptospira ilyithenensis TaxID=2484901 RepID=A0A4R9LPL6_9LEPT|nr:hypothetical protein [Leptospira ilyithenensis]TGN11025.1 hypothetical protein EHS11_07615 [Leptospira ilyithenensis]
MATKKSSSAAKKKAAAKKPAAKKNSVKKQSVREESGSLFASDESAHTSLQSAVKSTSETSEKSETGNGVYLFLVLAGVVAIGYLGYAKYSAKKNQTPVAGPAKVEAPKVEEKKTEAITEAPTAPEEAAKAATSNFLVDKIEKKVWSDASSYCKGIGANLPSKGELADFAKNAPKELKNDDKYWSGNESVKSKSKAIAVKLETGANFAEPKTNKNKVLCKN